MKEIIFFEMSDFNNLPRTFTTEQFYTFCTNYGIRLTSTNKKFIETNKVVYAICKPGKAELVLSGDYKNLRKNFNKAKNR